MTMTDEEARTILKQAPQMPNYLLAVRDERDQWQQHKAKLDSALALLYRDEPYSLRHMPSPPSGEPFGSASKNEVSEWRARNPNHPWARSWDHNDSLSQYVEDLRAGSGQLSRPTGSDPFRESRNAAQDIHAWAFLVPTAFNEARIASLSSALLHWDCGVTFDLVCAAYCLNARQLAKEIQELVRFDEAYNLRNSLTYGVARMVLCEWAV